MLLVNLSMLLLLLQKVVDRSLVLFLLMAHQLLFYVSPVPHSDKEIELSAEQALPHPQCGS